MILVLLLACPAEPPTAPVHSAPVVPVTPAPVVWSVDNIDELLPLAGRRESTVPKPLPPLPDYDTALQTLGGVVEVYDSDPDNPWALAHGLLARGEDLRLPDGREAVAHLFSAYAEPRSVGSRVLLGFPAEIGKVRVEPHTDLLLKNLEEAGVDPVATFATRHGSVPVADLYRWTLLKTYLVAETNHSSYANPNDMPWGLQALAAWAPADEVQWIATDGTPMDLDFLADFVTAVLARESAFLFDAMKRGQPFQRAGQPLFSYTCGGAHLAQGASYAVARGFGSPGSRKAVEAQVPLMFYRLPIELGIQDDALKQFRKERTRLLVQRMKFLGHWLETVSKMGATGIFVPDAQQLTAIEGAAQNLVLTVDALARDGVFESLPTLRKQNEQLYLDVIGDAAHAVRGLELALGRGTIRW